MSDLWIAGLILFCPAIVGLGVMVYWYFGEPFDIWENKD
jgi:hypothetical protein